VSFVAQLAIDDENNGHDSYSLDAASYLANTTVTGSVSGISVSSFNLYLLDQTQPISMLSSLDPPAPAAFAYQASLVRAYFSDYSNQKVVIRDFAPVEFGLFDFTVPEPGAAGSALAAAGTLAVVARRRVIARERGRHGP